MANRHRAAQEYFAIPIRCICSFNNSTMVDMDNPAALSPQPPGTVDKDAPLIDYAENSVKQLEDVFE